MRDEEILAYYVNTENVLNALYKDYSYKKVFSFTFSHVQIPNPLSFSIWLCHTFLIKSVASYSYPL